MDLHNFGNISMVRKQAVTQGSGKEQVSAIGVAAASQQNHLVKDVKLGIVRIVERPQIHIPANSAE